MRRSGRFGHYASGIWENQRLSDGHDFFGLGLDELIYFILELLEELLDFVLELSDFIFWVVL